MVSLYGFVTGSLVRPSALKAGLAKDGPYEEAGEAWISWEYTCRSVPARGQIVLRATTRPGSEYGW